MSKIRCLTVHGFLFLLVARLDAATLPNGFREELFADNISSPTMLNFAPDGRLFVAQQSGAMRVVKNGQVLPEPAFTVETDAQGEHGLLGIAFDPHFDVTPYIYVYYTAKTPAVHNRLSRFRMEGDRATEEKVLFDFDAVGTSIFHTGGNVKFGPDGKIYVGHGDNAGYPFLANAQLKTNLFGKVLRLNPDGSIPSDNPFYTTATGNNRAIWALGFRNPFTFSFSPDGQRLFVNDVGQATWEEINVVTAAGQNFGWPNIEGVGNDPAFLNPVMAYGHQTGSDAACAITGGAFYPTDGNFPTEYAGQYFYGDYCGNWVRTMNPVTYEVKEFARGIASNPVDLRVGPDGSLYYISKWLEGVYRISFATP